MLIIFSTTGYAIEIYKWVDDAGKSHMSDMVPEKYRAAAKRVSSRKYELSDAEYRDAQIRAAEIKSTKDKGPVEREPVDAIAPPDVPNVPHPQNLGQQSTCVQKWDAYTRSQECFAPFFIRTGQGSFLKPEAYLACQDIPSPAMVCDYDKRAGK